MGENAISKQAYDRVIFVVATISLTTVAYLFLLTWAIAYAATSKMPSWWCMLIPPRKARQLSWLWLSHAVAVVLATIPIALAIRFCLKRRELLAALCVSTFVFITMTPTDFLRYFANQPPFFVIWTVWEEVLQISALPLLVWILPVDRGQGADDQPA